MARKPLPFARILPYALLALPLLALAEKPPAEGIRAMPPQAVETFNAQMADSNSGHDKAAKLLKGYTPIYPASRLLSRKEGVCRVAFTIGTDGRPTRPEPDADADVKMCDHALYALRHWEFEPAMHDGEPVESRIRVPFQYSID